MAVGPVITLGLKYSPSLIVTLGYGIGAATAASVAGGYGREKQRRKVLKDIARLNELIIGREAEQIEIAVKAKPAKIDAYDEDEVLTLLLWN
jgi:hypothetical protein